MFRTVAEISELYPDAIVVIVHSHCIIVTFCSRSVSLLVTLSFDKGNTGNSLEKAWKMSRSNSAYDPACGIFMQCHKFTNTKNYID